MYRACLFRPSSVASCVLPQTCQINSESFSLQPASCVTFAVRCGVGWTGDRCFSCDNVDSDRDGRRDCEDSCPFDPTRFRAAHGACGVGSLLPSPTSNRSETLSGIPCQAWDKQSPHRHNAMQALTNNAKCSAGPNQDFPQAAKIGTPCVFPFVYNNTVYTECVDGSWCNTNRMGSPVEKAPCMECHEEKMAAAEVGAHNLCVNYDNSPEGPWCFTTNPLKRWERCLPPALDVSNYSVVLAGPSSGLVTSEGTILVSSGVSGVARISAAGDSSFFHQGCVDISALGGAPWVSGIADVYACSQLCHNAPLFAMAGSNRCFCMDQTVLEKDFVHIAGDVVDSSCVTTGIGLDPREGIECRSSCERMDIGNGETVGICFTDSMNSIWARCECKRACDKSCGGLPCGSSSDLDLASVYMNTGNKPTLCTIFTLKVLSGLCEEQPCYVVSQQVIKRNIHSLLIVYGFVFSLNNGSFYLLSSKRFI